MYSDWIKGLYWFIFSLPFVLLFICCTSILCRYKSKIGDPRDTELCPSVTKKSKIIEDSLKNSNLKTDRDLEAEIYF